MRRWLTASLAPDTRERCLAAGMDEHLTKPLDLRKFSALLTGFINASRAANTDRSSGTSGEISTDGRAT